MAAKIKDGLFIGDAETSQSEVFINDNKISNLINLSGREVHNVWASHGLVYLTYYWEDRPDYKLFVNHEDALLTDIVEFIDVSISHGISVLLFSRNGTGRCVVAACVYLMMKYRWGFEKTYDYVYSKKPDIDLNKGFIQQMFALDMKLLAARQKASAQRLGVDSGFKIEANMTISDISAMLPVAEAKRWNAWDPDYVLGGAASAEGEMDGESKGGEGGGGSHRKDSKAEAKRGGGSGSRGGGVVTANGRLAPAAAAAAPGTGEEDELVLIYSFLNSKNTITVLPGPYLDVYETHKNFKLKFNPVCFEEDVNWFPSNNNNSSQQVRGVLKGARARHQQQLTAAGTAAQPKTSSNGATVSNNSSSAGGGPGGRDRDSKRSNISNSSAAGAGGGSSASPAADAKTYESNGATTTTAGAAAKSVVALENIAPMYIINSQREAANNNNSNSNNNNNSSNNSRDRDRDREATAQMYYSHPSATGDHHHQQQHSHQFYSNPTEPASPPATSSAANHHHNNHAGSSSNNSVGSLQPPQQFSSDLYEFVGISTEQGGGSRTKSSSNSQQQQRTWGPRDSIAVHRDQSNNSISDGNGGGSSGGSHVSDNDYKYSSGADYTRNDSDYNSQQQQQQQDLRRQQQQLHPAHSGSGGSSSRGNSSNHAHAPNPPPMSAEDRLRSLMADMQRNKATSGAAAVSSSGGIGMRSSHDYGRSDGASGGGSAPSGPSLYELATMKLPYSASSNSRGAPASRLEEDGPNGGGREDEEEDELTDPLSAFQRQHVYQQPTGGTSSRSGSGGGPSGSSGGAVRARHDILTHTTGSSNSSSGVGGRPGTNSSAGSRYTAAVPTPTGPRSAWAGTATTGSAPTSGGSRGVSPSNSRPASPSPGMSGGGGGGSGAPGSGYGNVPSRYASPSAKRTAASTAGGGGGSVSSNLSINSINSAGSNMQQQPVGTGINSSTRVYR